MKTKFIDTEIKLYVLISQKEELLENDFDNVLKDYLDYYQGILNNLTEEEITFLLNHFSNKIPKKQLFKNSNISENKYYSDLRRIIKKVEKIVYEKWYWNFKMFITA